ncbi:hypothetical protein D0B54_03570 [Solimonas sp. K1W22B-7]|uniref:LVIVD repeat-containing protein n=1 Tax=Solimonas sp. K1W22B-7 TaxID=2303331 RepID=UPI000E333D67|nr:hypothetical protein [Solimonas sp. K1W22B-7]AXQ27807.1 hypothetical protein D0B54_03570 [Solimonas sp. K1W22B-7]
MAQPRTLAPLLALLLAACGQSSAPVTEGGGGPPLMEGAVPAARCGPGSLPETGLQGQVPLEDRVGERSQHGYQCNLERVGQYQGQGAGLQFTWHGDCGYFNTSFPNLSTVLNPGGVQVLDVSDPAQPRLTGQLRTLAMLNDWESLKASAQGLLAGVAGYEPVGGFGLPFFDVYDVSGDCTQPVLKASVPLNLPSGHEGAWSPDGRTYYASSTYYSTLTAIDLSEPESPRLLYVGLHPVHGLSISADGNRAYLAQPGNLTTNLNVDGLSTTVANLLAQIGAVSPFLGNGLTIVDISDIQARKPLPQARVISSLFWADGSLAQTTIPITVKGRPYIVFIDENGQGGVRFIDIADETRPQIVSHVRLEAQLAEHRSRVANDGASNGALFNYEAHYCDVDRTTDPTIMACSEWASGIRVFDIRDPLRPREIAYYNPPAQKGKAAQLPHSFHAGNVFLRVPLGTGQGLLALPGGNGNVVSPLALDTDWCTANIRIIPERGELWTTCHDNGFMVLRFTNGVWPFGS